MDNEKSEITDLVFIHYFGGSASSWQWVTPALHPHYNCICVNLPGFGNAPPIAQPTIEKMSAVICRELTKRSISSFAMVGHSMGAKLALYAAARCAIKPKHIILVAPSPPSFEPITEEAREKMLELPNKQNSMEAVTSASRLSLSPEKFDLAVNNRIQTDPATWRWWILEGMNESIVNELPKIHCSISLIASQSDPIIQPATIQTEVIDRLPITNVSWTSNIGHLIPLEAPHWLAQEIDIHIHKIKKT